MQQLLNQLAVAKDLVDQVLVLLLDVLNELKQALELDLEVASLANHLDSDVL